MGAVAIFASWIAYQVTLQLNFSALAASLPFWIFAVGRIPGTWILSAQGAHAATGGYLHIILPRGDGLQTR